MNDDIEVHPEDSADPMTAANSRPRPYSPRPKPISNLQRLLQLGLFAVVAVAAWMAWEFKLHDLIGEGRKAHEKTVERRALYDAVTNAVSAQLKAPRTAIFCGPEELTEGDRGSVSGYVDSQNSFGALIRTRFTAHYDRVYGATDNFKVTAVEVAQEPEARERVQYSPLE
jgi:hypothetical protein